MRRAGLPIVLALINGALVGVWLGVLAPMTDDFERQKRSVQASNSGLLNQIDIDEQALADFEENSDQFAGLQDHGFLDPQDRMGAAKLLERLRDIHGLTSIHYEIAPEQVLDDRTTRTTGFAIVSTRVTVAMRGLFDADLLEFVQAVVDEFPGQVRPLSISLQKLQAPTEETLSALRKGELVDFVAGELVFEWNTLRPIVKIVQG